MKKCNLTCHGKDINHIEHCEFNPSPTTMKEIDYKGKHTENCSFIQHDWGVCDCKPSEEKKEEALYQAIKYILSPEGRKKLMKLVEELKDK